VKQKSEITSKTTTTVAKVLVPVVESEWVQYPLFTSLEQL